MSNEIMPEPDTFTSEVCWHYYVNELTQAEIAKAMGVTRLRVNQAIQRARATGVVRIEIESPFISRLELQDRLQEKFGIEKALIAPAHPDPSGLPGGVDYHTAVGTALASYVSQRLRAGDWHSIGVSWGMTLQCCIDRLQRHHLPDLEVISMLGGTSRGEAFNSFGIASGLAQRLGARYSLLAAPIFLAPQVDRAAFLSQEIFADHYRKFDKLDCAILTASDISDRSYLIQTGLPGGVMQADLTAAGAIGDVVGRFLDRDGNVVSAGLGERTIGIGLDTLQKVPERILAAAGAHKVAIIRAVLKAGIANVLISDDRTAHLLLQDQS